MQRLFATTFAMAWIIQLGSAHAQSVALCGQTVQYNLVPPAPDVPPEYRAFTGVWSGSWANQLCHVLVVESITKEGNVVTKYVWGANPDWGIKSPGVSKWEGKIIQGVLTLRRTNPDISVEYRVKSPAEMTGAYTRGKQFAGSFTKR